jgi:hypothetical protein
MNYATPPTIPGSVTLSAIKVINTKTGTIKTENNKLGFFGKLVNRQSTDGSLLSMAAVLANYGLTRGYIQEPSPLIVSVVSSTKTEFGISISASESGNIVAIGASETDDRVGAAWVFTKESTGWIYQTLESSAIVDGRKGTLVEVSEDGSTIAVSNSNTVIIYKKQLSLWTQQTSLLGSAVSDFSMSADGTMIIIRNSNAGVFTYKYSNSEWVQLANLVVDINDLSLSPDGSTMVATEYPNQTKIYILVNDVWQLQSSIITGTSSSLSYDGNTLALADSNFNSDEGIVRIFKRVDAQWTEVASITRPGYESFGLSIDLSSSGNDLVVGNINSDDSLGETIAYQAMGNIWTQYGPILRGGEYMAGQGMSYGNGYSVCIVNDGNTIFTSSLMRGGIAWEFTRNI